MKAPTAIEGSAEKPKVRRRRMSGLMRGLLVLAMMLSVAALFAMSTDLAVPTVFLLLPSLVTLLIDSTPGLGLARAMLLFQATVCIGPIENAYYDCFGLGACMAKICTPLTVLIAWLAAGCAWALTEVAPIGLRLLEDVRLRTRRVDLQKQRADLVAEWGLEPASSGNRGGRQR